MRGLDQTTCYIILGIIGIVLVILLITFFTLLKKTKNDAKSSNNVIPEVPTNNNENLNQKIENKFETLNNTISNEEIKIVETNNDQNKIS